MRLAGKTAFLLLLFMLISPLFAEPFPEPQPGVEDEGSPSAPQPDEELPLDNWLLFFEELFILEETFFLGESPMGEEEVLPDEETFLSEEIPPGEETPLSEEISPGEETLLSEEMPPGEETPPSEEISPGKEPLLAEESFPDDDDDFFFFEAPPLIFEAPTFEIRSFDAIFPNLSHRERSIAMGQRGLRHSFVKDESPTFIPDSDMGIDLLGSIMKKNPSHFIEALVVVPYNEKEFDLLDIYNALGRIEKIKNYPVSISGNDFYIFTESTRIESDRRRRAIPDPLPATTLPFSQTMYLCLREINFGNLFIRTDMSISVYGITYSMTNFTDVRYYLVPIMKAERFNIIIYLEPVKEGILIYSMSGFYLPGFIADKVNLTPNINRRIEIFIRWITDGLREQESAAAEGSQTPESSISF